MLIPGKSSEILAKENRPSFPIISKLKMKVRFRKAISKTKTDKTGKMNIIKNQP